MSELTVKFVEPVKVENTSMSSVELKRNAKGGTEVIVKVYNGDPLKARDDAEDLYDRLITKYQ